MFYIRDISLFLGDRVLLDNISFMVSPKDRVGLIGKNGVGKSTLLKIIAGQISPDAGKLEFPAKASLGYLKQEFELNENLNVLDEAMTCHEEALNIHHRMEQVQQDLHDRDDFESQNYLQLMEELAHLTSRLEHFNLTKLEISTVKILKGLGFSDDDLLKPVSTFSGGWKMRIELAKLLIRQPDILMLDEPTNHLDIESIIWLENYLNEYSGTVIIISHDKQFLQNVCNRIIEIQNGRIQDYRLSYDKYLVEKARQDEMLRSAFVNQQKEIAQKEKTINRFMAKATKTKMAQSMKKQLDKVERIELPQEDTGGLNIKFTEVPRAGRIVFEGRGLSRYFGEKCVFKNVDLVIERGEKVGFVGQNGQGKTTMARIINRLLPPSSGTLEYGSNVQISYYAQNQSELLDLKKTVLEVMEDKAPAEMRPKVRSILGAFLFSGDDVDKKVSVLSGGERARLAMASLMMQPCNLLILDEPTNHLDMYSKEILKSALLEYEGTLILISHDREFLSGITDKIIEFKDGQIATYLGDINYFLDKKHLSDMRSIELQKKSEPESTSSTGSKSAISAQEERQLKKQLHQVEREIAKLESRIADIEKEISLPDFYTGDTYLVTSQKYDELKKTLQEKMEEWEQVVMILG